MKRKQVTNNSKIKFEQLSNLITLFSEYAEEFGC